jgi:hypothetical protein
VQLLMIRPIREVEAQLATSGVHARLQAETRKQVVMKAAERQRNTAAAADAPDKQNKTLAEAIRRHADSIDPPVLNQRRRDRLKIPHPQVWTIYLDGFGIPTPQPG